MVLHAVCWVQWHATCLVHRCDGDNVCSIVCKRGTVAIEPWLQHAIKTQVRRSA